MFPLSLIIMCLTCLPQDAAAPQWGQLLQWSLDGAPQAREHAAFVPDPLRARAVMLAGSGYRPYGAPLGDAWAFDFGSQDWTELKLVGDEIIPGGSRRVSPIDGGAFLHGGYAEGFESVGELWRLQFESRQVVVELIPQENPPPARLLHAFACDPAGERFVVFGGGGDDQALADTWIGQRTEAGVRWEQLNTTQDPGSRFGFSFAHDIQNGLLLVCGGQIPPEDEEQTAMVVARDLWALDFTAEAPQWTRLAEYSSDAFPGRRNPAFTFDDDGGDLFVWGGTGDGASALPDLYVVRTREPGAPVERITQPDTVATRASGFGVIDRTHNRALLGFGNTSAGPFDDLVEVHLRKPAGATSSPAHSERQDN